MGARRGVAVFVLLTLGALWLTGLGTADPNLGQKPLSDRGPGEFYLDPVRGEPGLFPGGANAPSGAHLLYGRSKLAALVPRNAAGTPSPTGFIGFLGVGMSNTNQEWARFERIADGAAEHGGRIVLVDAAMGGIAANRMADPSEPYWLTFDSRLTTAGLTVAQVQVVWLKQGLLPPYIQPTWPDQVDAFQAEIESIVGILRGRLPNLQVVYFSSRIYAGWGASPGQPFAQEPFGFECAFGFKHAIEDQIAGVGNLGSGPWLTWGPYLWADGTTPRADGLTWQQADMEDDSTHPSPSGELKVANLLRGFFGSDDNAASWYGPGNGPPVVVREASGDAFVDTANPSVRHGGDLFLDFTSTRPVHVKFDLTALPSTPLVRAKLSLLADPEMAVGGGSVFLASSSAWNEATISASNAPAPSGPALRGWSAWSRGAVVDADVTAAVQAALAAQQASIAFVLTTPVASGSRLVSREAGDAPRLVLTFDGGELFRDAFEVGSAAAWAGATP